ncbi:MAG: hypothetical protein QM280_02735 [Bacteroidota bacterium]|nr:hypothetical protein [Paludibacteraceae bacterium]MDI9536768.1 hypothetical protein [Bacteroidota bacterium]HHT60608.1 hypothetical protein [Bacteroidales bacterium]HOA46709.1 hypothetical protein [Paludibacteraceae bacterium]HOH70557.1 hypothetical protein [Paludibacteraceae bacterium]
MTALQKNSIKWLLILLFVFYHINDVFFTHVHIEGTKITTHSHPYSNQNHQHSKTNFNLIQALTSVLTLLSIGVGFCLLPLLAKPERIIAYYKQPITHFPQTSNCLRAPPVFAL